MMGRKQPNPPPPAIKMRQNPPPPPPSIGKSNFGPLDIAISSLTKILSNKKVIKLEEINDVLNRYCSEIGMTWSDRYEQWTKEDNDPA